MAQIILLVMLVFLPSAIMLTHFTLKELKQGQESCTNQVYRNKVDCNLNWKKYLNGLQSEKSEKKYSVKAEPICDNCNFIFSKDNVVTPYGNYCVVPDSKNPQYEKSYFGVKMSQMDITCDCNIPFVLILTINVDPKLTKNKTRTIQFKGNVPCIKHSPSNFDGVEIKTFPKECLNVNLDHAFTFTEPGIIKLKVTDVYARGVFMERKDTKNVQVFVTAEKLNKVIVKNVTHWNQMHFEYYFPCLQDVGYFNYLINYGLNSYFACHLARNVGLNSQLPSMLCSKDSSNELHL